MTEREPAKPSNGSRRTTAGAGFFTGGARRTHLEQLRHLNQWSRRVLLITGPRGAGKTVLYRQFSATLEPRAKAARIDATRIHSPREVLYAVVQGFGVAAPADADGRLLGELVAAHAQEQDSTDRYCVVLVDEAELLEGRTLEVLVRLAAESPLRVVLFGEVRLVPAVERAAAASGASWHEIRLAAFDADDVREYLEWWFRSQGHHDRVPLSDAQVAEIARLSEGLPGRIDPMARALLAKLESRGDELQRQRFPTLHRALLAVLVGVVALVYLVWQPAEDADDGRVRIETVEVPPPQVARAPGDRADAAPAEEPGVALEDGRAGTPSVPVESPGPDRSLDVGSGESPGSEPGAGRDAERPSAQVPATEPDAPERVPVTTAPGDTARTERPPSEQPPVAESPAVEPPAAEPPAAQTPPVAVSNTEGPRDAAWIMSQAASRHTLQLVSFSTAERAAAYLADQDDPGAFAVFRQQRDGRILHVVIYGNFSSRADAQRAATDLPQGVGGVQPWIRSFGDVQAAVRTALQR